MAKRDKPLTKHQQIYNQQSPHEIWRGLRQFSIEEAILHAETNLEMRGKPAELYWGKMCFTNSVVVGWAVNDRKRYRLDYAHAFAEENQEAAKWAGTKQTQGIPGRTPQRRELR
jgi:hypothetical protein